MKYELFYLIGASREAEAEKIKEEVKRIVLEAEATFEEKETFEKRRMAYQIKHETHGIYIAQRFEMDPEKMGEVSRKINLHPGVLRFLISKADELPSLKSKEERISEANSRPQVKSEAKTEEQKAASDDAIDKKLEEILNI